jgi:hypothetical protein
MFGIRTLLRNVAQRQKSDLFPTIDINIRQPLKKWRASSDLDALTLEMLLQELNDYLSSKDPFLNGACVANPCT